MNFWKSMLLHVARQTAYEVVRTSCLRIKGEIESGDWTDQEKDSGLVVLDMVLSMVASRLGVEP